MKKFHINSVTTTLPDVSQVVMAMSWKSRLRDSLNSAVMQRTESRELGRQLKDTGLKSNRLRRTGAVFYLNVKYGQAKGSVAAGETMIDARTGHNATLGGRRYASVRVENETLGAAGVSLGRSGNLAYVPVIPGSVIITDGVERFTDNGAGVLVSSATGGTNGTIEYGTGAWAVSFAVAPASAILGDYKYNYETKANDAVPEVNIEVKEETLTAEDFPLSAKYTLAAAIDLERAHGLNLEDEIVKYLSGNLLCHYVQECTLN